MIRFLKIALMLCAASAWAQSPLAPVKTDSPRDTMVTYLKAMNAYRGLIEHDPAGAKEKLNRAVRTLQLDKIPALGRQDKGAHSAILLKETIDRVIKIKPNLIPDTDDILRWRLKDTEITIVKVAEGSRSGEYLFSHETVVRAREFYDKVKELPYVSGSGKGANYNQPLVERYVPDWLQGDTFGLFNWQWLGLLIAILLGYLLKGVAAAAVWFGKKLTKKSKFNFDDHLLEAVEKPIGLLAATGLWFVAIKFLQFQDLAYDVLIVANQVVFSFATIWLFLRLTDVANIYLKKLAGSSDFPFDDQMVPLVHRALRVAVYVVGILITIQNLGVNVMSLLAGLGLGGLAFALAAKDTAANLFGSIMILWDKPFKVGDWVITDGVEGTVEEIGFRSTRVRTFYNSQVSIPNSQLANANVDNMGRRRYRRIKTVLGVTYGTAPEKLEAFLEGIKNIIRANEYTRKDYFHVVFNNYGPSSLDILIYLFLEVPDWAEELVQRQNLFLEIYRLADELGVDFAFPSQSLYVESMADKDQQQEIQKLDADTLRKTAQSFGEEGQNAKPQGLGISFLPFDRKAEIELRSQRYPKTVNF